MSKAKEQSIKQKLKNISKESQTPFNNLLDTLFLERFLIRIGKSKYAENLIFKGGMCLAQIVNLGRETRDIDFLLTKMSANKKVIESIFKEISNINLKDDIAFSNIEVSVLSIEHKKYPGYRISIKGALGQIQNKVFIDIGVGDVVRPKALEVKLMNFNGPLFEQNIELKSYPAEYIFSEKLEAILYLGKINSRMKDFYDCHHLILENALDRKKLKTAIKETLENRKTKLSLIPDSDESFNKKWNDFSKKNNINNLKLEEVIKKINDYIASLI